MGGTHPALVEAMGYGNCVIANSTSENIEVLGESGFFYKKNDAVDLSKKLQHVVDNPDLALEYGEKARSKALKDYAWSPIVDRYESLFLEIINP